MSFDEREQHRRCMRNLRARNKALGLCFDCSRPAVVGLVLCQLHREQTNRRQREANRFYRSMGINKRAGRVRRKKNK
jgi:hypothetical protein